MVLFGAEYRGFSRLSPWENRPDGGGRLSAGDFEVQQCHTVPMEMSGFLPPDEFWAMQARWEEQIRAGAGLLPLYRIAGWERPVTLGAWQMDASEGSAAHMNGTGLANITSHLEVITTTADAVASCSSRFISSGGAPRDRDDLLRRHEVFRGLPQRFASLRIDGEPSDFTVWDDASVQANGIWLAAGSHGGFGIAIVAQGTERPAPESLALETVADIEPLLTARRAQLRRMRGEG